MSPAPDRRTPSPRGRLQPGRPSAARVYYTGAAPAEGGAALARGARTSRAVAVLAAVIGLAALAVLPARGAEPKRPTADPAMSRGPAAAPVTIFEFSDYQ